MRVPSLHSREDPRLEELRQLKLLDTEPEAIFDSITRLAAAIAGTPVAMINLIDATRQWPMARVGTDLGEIPREISFCAHAILRESGPMLIEDALQDERFCDNPLVCGPASIRFYLGFPLRSGPERLPVGALCVIDREPRSLGAEARAQLELLAQHVEQMLARQRESRLRHAQQKETSARAQWMEALLDTMDGGVVVHGHDGAILSCNQAAQKILGLTEDQILGRSPYDARWRAIRLDGAPFPAEQHPAMVALRTGCPVTGELMGVESGDRSLVWLMVNAVPWRRASHTGVEAVIASFSDVTSLMLAETRISRIFSLSPDLLCVLKGDSIVQVNQAWASRTGLEPDTLPGRHFFDLLCPEDREQARQSLVSLGDASPLAYFEGRLRGVDGELRQMRWVAVWGQGEVLLVAHDVTEQRQQAEQLQKAKEAAEAVSKAKGEFLANMSHEIRTPMNGILGLADVLMQMEMPPEQRELVQFIQKSGAALVNILNDVLDWSRLEAGKLEVERVPVDLREVLHDVVALLLQQASAKGLLLQTEIDEGEHAFVMGDAGRLRQVFFNLIGNAIKFTFRGSVRVRVEGEGEGMVRCHVIDTGIGISPEQQSRLFQRFSQADSSTTRRFGGSGLGLVIAQQLAGCMGGSLSVESEPGRGSCFSLRIPRSCEGPRAGKSQPDGLVARPLRLLVAEDNLVNRRVIAAMLTRDGHSHEFVENGQDAFVAFQRASWDAVLMDVQMPVMDGLQATRLIRALEARQGGRRTPILALSASAMPEDSQACLEAGMDAFLSKPFTLQALRSMLSTLSP